MRYTNENAKKPWSDGELATNKMFVKAEDRLSGEWKTLFHKNMPISLEIGSGKGRFARDMSFLYPEQNFIAFEKMSVILSSGLRDTREAFGICKNLLFVQGDAESIPLFFAENEIASLYLNFSDPWRNRTRWHKRRLTHVHFLKMYERVLQPSGKLILKTDNKDLFLFSLSSLKSRKWEIEQEDNNYQKQESDPMTEYEERFRGQGKPIHRLIAKNPTC